MLSQNHVIPIESTYRLQFHAGFTFRDAAEATAYLADLGVTHAYASPYFKAKAGSTHGYDVVDPCRLNPEVGSTADYERWLAELSAHRMSHILDIVPNHTGVATNDNPWWNAALAGGPSSCYGRYFDIAWRGSPRPELRDKILLPLLGDLYGNVLERGELKLVLEEGRLQIAYYDRRFPLAPQTYGMVLGDSFFAPTVEQSLKPLRQAIERLPATSDDRTTEACERSTDEALSAVQNALRESSTNDPAVREALEKCVERINGQPGITSSFDQLHALLEAQYYRLSYWRVASDEINYRRFFDINDLAALNMERPEVFEATHTLALKLVREGKVAGLRVDHPDGLYDPRQYFERLQKAAAAGRLYVVAEKILAVDEPLDASWPVAGTTGYEFVNDVNGLFIDPQGEAPLTKAYVELCGDETSFHELAVRKKRLILQTALASELQMLAHRADRLAQKHRRWRDFTLAGLRTALCEVIACFGVYRTYVQDERPSENDRRRMEAAVEDAVARNPAIDAAIFHFIRDAVLQACTSHFDEADRAEQLKFAGKFQQLCAPATAKGVEDTAFYIYNRLIALNEVGGEPGRFGVSPKTLHDFFQNRQKHWPTALSPLSTHDTKRSEDTRARINVLSEIPEKWRSAVERWTKLNEGHRGDTPSGAAPDRNEEYLFYQTLIGAWPIDADAADEVFVNRIKAYMQKAMREAKVHTSWTRPNEPHEQAVATFVERALANGAFIKDFRAFQSKVAEVGLFNSLSQTLLRLTAPGVPDTYQGTDLLDFSLVDPDNRRPVNYAMRHARLKEIQSRAASDAASLAKELLETRHDGGVKLYVTWRVLTARRELPGLFTTGDYLPLQVHGAQSDHLFAFARRHEGRRAVVVVPRLLNKLDVHARLPLGQSVWKDTFISLPDDGRGRRFTHLFTGRAVSATITPQGPAIAAGEMFADFPVALLLDEAD